MRLEVIFGCVCMGCGGIRSDRHMGTSKPAVAKTYEQAYVGDDVRIEVNESKGQNFDVQKSHAVHEPRNLTESDQRIQKRKKQPKKHRPTRPDLDIERTVLMEIQPLLLANPHWFPPRIPTSAAMELGVRISKSIVPVYASFIGIEEIRVTPNWIGVIGDGIPTADSWTIFVDAVRRSTVDYLRYPSCLGTRFVEASKLSRMLPESYVNAPLVEETIVRLLASPPPEGTCMTDTYAQVMSVLSQEQSPSRNKDWTDLVNELHDFYSIVTVIGGLSSVENALATNARDQFRTISRSIITDPSKLRTYKAQLRVNTSRLVKLVEDYLSKVHPSQLKVLAQKSTAIIGALLCKLYIPPSDMLRYWTIAISTFVWGCRRSDTEEISANKLQSPQEFPRTRMHDGLSATSLTTLKPTSSWRLFTTSTTTTPRALSDEELLMSRYCALLAVYCDQIGLSGAWFTDMLNSFEGKESLKSALTYLHRQTRVTVGDHVEADVRVPHCGVSRILASLTAMHDFHNDERTRDVAVYMARKLVSHESEQLCDFRVYMLLDDKLPSTVNREIIHRLNIRLLMLSCIEPRQIRDIIEVISTKNTISDWVAFAASLDDILRAELNEATIEYPHMDMRRLLGQISSL